MKLRGSVPFIKLIGKSEDYWFFKKRKSSLCIIKKDDGLFLNQNKRWVKSIDLAWIGTFSEMYEYANGLSIKNSINFVFVQL